MRYNALHYLRLIADGYRVVEVSKTRITLESPYPNDLETVVDLDKLSKLQQEGCDDGPA